MQVVERLYPEVLAHLQDIGDTKQFRRFGFNVTNVTSTAADPKESTGETAVSSPAVLSRKGHIDMDFKLSFSDIVPVAPHKAVAEVGKMGNL